MKFLWILFILSTAFSVQAKPRPEWSLHLDSKIEYSYFLSESASGTNRELYKMDLNPLYNWKYQDAWRIVAKPVFTTNPNNLSEEEKYFFDSADSYLSYKTDLFTFKAGSNIFSWGVTDGYNPLDIINSKQYFDPLHSRKLGALSLTFSQAFAEWDYELIYIPQNKGALLPGSQSRWLPREVFVPQVADNDLILNLPEKINYTYSKRKNINHALDNNFALRLQRRGENIDMGLSFYEGVASFPLIQPVVTGNIVQVSPKTIINVNPDISLNTWNYRIQQSGFTFVSNQMDFLFKAASAYTKNLEKNDSLQAWTHENILALEKTFNIGDDFMLIGVLQYSFIFSDKENDSNLSAMEVFRRAAMLGGRISWKEVWNISFLSLYDTIHSSTFHELSIGRRFADAWNLNISGNIIQGSPQTALGVYDKNDSLSLSLSRSF